MGPFFLCLEWIREDGADREQQAFNKGYALGVCRGGKIEPWEREYLWNVAKARARGISA